MKYHLEVGVEISQLNNTIYPVARRKHCPLSMALELSQYSTVGEISNDSGLVKIMCGGFREYRFTKSQYSHCVQ
jgi:hypothetical protein